MTFEIGTNKGGGSGCGRGIDGGTFVPLGGAAGATGLQKSPSKLCTQQEVMENVSLGTSAQENTRT